MVKESSKSTAGSKVLISLRPDDVYSIFGWKNNGVDVFGFLSTEGEKATKKYQLVLLARKMIGKLLQDGHVRQWPQGNLALLQYLYWEKVQPITGPKYDPLALLSPLMRNWTEDMAVRRDKYDYEYGRGVGMIIRIDDNIIEEYRLKKIAEEEAQKTKKASSKKSNITGMRKEGSTSEASSQKPTMDRILSEMNELRKEMLRLPELCAQRMIEKLNKTGVFYKPSNLEEDEENLYGGINESSNDGGLPKKEFVYQKDDSDRFRTPSKMNLQKDDDGVDVTSRGNTPFYCTPEYWDSFKGDMDDPTQVPEVSDEKAATSLGTDEIASHASLGSQGVQEEVEEVTGRRKRRGSQHVKSPYVVPKPNKRAKRSAKGKFFQNGGVNKSSDEYDVVKASIKYVRAHEYSQKHAKTEIFNDGMEEGLTVRRACQIINHEWLSGDTYIPLNKENTHWVTVVMHSGKREFQVLDSLMTGKLDSVTRELVEDLRKQLAEDIQEANATGIVNYPDVSNWPIQTYDMPKQHDG
ncbi:uncharacterized protein [Aegilops tauschii subsp. strangulata]|uniref:uncharacterized protein n=1 Tax=Aegilops tauschii subsp. strangulata TaxID=200361 RepID=UPI001E1CA873|nr:uncharacterized protein LOC109780000 [Aegilops tauschii subsp. strangulata]